MLAARGGGWSDESSFDSEVEAARDAVRQKCLPDCPTVLSRLGRLACYRDPVTGHYIEEHTTAAFGEILIDAVLRTWHEQLFAEWLNSTIEQQARDLRLFLTGEAGCDPIDLIRVWQSQQPYRQFPPPRAMEVERRLFYLHLDVLLSLLAVDLDLRSGARNGMDSRVASVLRLLSEPECRMTTLAEVSTQTELSVERVRHLFKKETGSRFRTFMQRLRIKHAAHLLRTTNQPVKDIAAVVEYSAEPNFCRAFKAVLSAGPSEFREHWKNLRHRSRTNDKDSR